MEEEILDALEDLGYTGDVSSQASLSAMVDGTDGGPRNVQFTQLVGWVSSELKVLGGFEEQVTPITVSDDHSSFSMEVSALLKEMDCPHTQITEGNVSQRLDSKEKRLFLLNYLLGELEATKMISAANPDQSMKVPLKESGPASDLKNILKTLGFPKPPNNITSQQLFSKAHDKLQETLKSAPVSLKGKPLFSGILTEKQWSLLDQMQREMQSEYRMRRLMLLKRLDVTIQSFQWSDKAKARENELTQAYRGKRDLMAEEPNVSVGHLLAAREDLAVLEKTSNAAVRKNTRSNLNKVLIGKVPDRGGRGLEYQQPPAEMPSWQQRGSAGGGYSNRGGGGGGRSGNRGGYGGDSGGYDGSGGGRGYKGGGRGRGGGGFSSDRVQGGWNQKDGGGYDNRDKSQNNFNERKNYNNQGGYHNGGGGYDNREHYSRGGGRGGRGRGRW